MKIKRSKLEFLISEQVKSLSEKRVRSASKSKSKIYEQLQNPIHKSSKLLLEVLQKFNQSAEKKSKKLLQSLIFEASVQQLQQQFVDTDKISQEVFDEIVKVTKSKGAYATWLVKQVVEGIVDTSQIANYEEYFKIFNKHKREFEFPDISKYKGEELVRKFEQFAEELIERNKRQTGTDTGQSKNLLPPKAIEELESVGINFLGIVKGYQVFEIPTSVAESQEAYKMQRKYLGQCAGREKGELIRLCTIAGEDEFYDYLDEGPLFIFFNLADPKSPYQFFYGGDSNYAKVEFDDDEDYTGYYRYSEFMNKDNIPLI